MMTTTPLSMAMMPATRPLVGTETPERRTEDRHPRRDRAFVQVVDGDEADVISLTFACEIIEVSPVGVRIRSDTQMTAGCGINLLVDAGSQPGKFLLSGEVRWVSWEASGEFHVGVEMQDRFDTDIDEWRRLQKRLG